MPTVLRLGPHRFFFFADDYREPVHIHVRRDRLRAKFWLDPVQLQENRGFAGHEVNKLEAVVVEHERTLLEAWPDFFGDRF